MQRPEPVVLESRHLRLEPVAADHLGDLRAAVAADPGAFAVSGPGAQPDGIDGWHRSALAELAAGTRLPYVCVLPDGRAVGSSSYMNIEPAVDRLEVGHTWYGGPWQGGVVNPAAKRLLLGHAFETLGAQRVSLQCDARNARSRAAILKLGATFEGVLRSWNWKIDRPGELRDTAVYSILVAEWPAVRDGLDARLSGSA